MRDGNGHRALVRRRNGRMLAGVCAGVADYLGVDTTLVRVLWAVVSLVTGGAGVLAYLVAWIIIPGKTKGLPSPRALSEKSRTPGQADVSHYSSGDS